MYVWMCVREGGRRREIQRKEKESSLLENVRLNRLMLFILEYVDQESDIILHQLRPNTRRLLVVTHVCKDSRMFYSSMCMIYTPCPSIDGVVGR